MVRNFIFSVALVSTIACVEPVNYDGDSMTENDLDVDGRTERDAEDGVGLVPDQNTVFFLEDVLNPGGAEIGSGVFDVVNLRNDQIVDDFGITMPETVGGLDYRFISLNGLEGEYCLQIRWIDEQCGEGSRNPDCYVDLRHDRIEGDELVEWVENSNVPGVGIYVERGGYVRPYKDACARL